MIAIIDYGMGNIHSVRKALETLGAQTAVATTPRQIIKADKIVLPGVGAFGEAVSELNSHGLASCILEQIQDKKVFLGICLGMHLLFETSQESPQARGLGLFKGTVERFQPQAGLKVPHMGWNQIVIRQVACPLFKGLEDGSSVYFCHSFFPLPQDSSIVAATTEYGAEFGSILWKDNVFATQFHPEKSQGVGLKILENFVNI